MGNFLNLATKIASNNQNRWKHGAILVKSGRVISMAPNIYKNDPDLFKREAPEDHEHQRQRIIDYCSEHAEARVVRLAGDNARGSVVYVARVNKDGNSRMSKPCDNCHRILTEAGVKTVVYTENDETFTAFHPKQEKNVARSRKYWKNYRQRYATAA